MTPTSLLLFCLFTATVLGIGVGVCSWHLLLSARFRREVENMRLSSARLDNARSSLDDESALVILAKEQRQRIDALEEKNGKLEERHRKQRQRDRVGRRKLFERKRTAQPVSDSDRVPVLKRRVGGVFSPEAKGKGAKTDQKLDVTVDFPERQPDSRMSGHVSDRTGGQKGGQTSGQREGQAEGQASGQTGGQTGGQASNVTNSLAARGAFRSGGARNDTSAEPEDD